MSRIERRRILHIFDKFTFATVQYTRLTFPFVKMEFFK